MLIKNKRYFALGILMALGFLGMLLLIISPLFSGKNGLEFADNLFNSLAKGSSYFIPKVEKSVEKYAGKQFSITIKFDNAEDAERVAKLLMTSGEKVEQKEGELKIEGDLGRMLIAATKDSDLMYKNDGEKVKSTYGYDEKQVMKDWWQGLTRVDKELKKKRMVEEAATVSDVVKKVVEPGYNFYKIEAKRVSQKAGTMTGLLAFYVIYTIWWGFAILYIFEGIGLTAKKAKVKKEV